MLSKHYHKTNIKDNQTETACTDFFLINIKSNNAHLWLYKGIHSSSQSVHRFSMVPEMVLSYLVNFRWFVYDVMF